MLPDCRVSDDSYSIPQFDITVDDFDDILDELTAIPGQANYFSNVRLGFCLQVLLFMSYGNFMIRGGFCDAKLILDINPQFPDSFDSN